MPPAQGEFALVIIIMVVALMLFIVIALKLDGEGPLSRRGCCASSSLTFFNEIRSPAFFEIFALNFGGEVDRKGTDLEAFADSFDE